MPCTGGPNSIYNGVTSRETHLEQENAQLRKQRDVAARTACIILSKLEKEALWADATGNREGVFSKKIMEELPKEQKNWWKNHKIQDAKKAKRKNK
jgi:hypothetical protein